LLLYFIQLALGPTDAMELNFDDPHDSFAALITYYGVWSDGGHAPFSPAFNELMRDRLKKYAFAFMLCDRCDSLAS